SGGTAGVITLEALQPTGGVAQITIGNATLSGGDINLTATSTISSGIALVTAPDAEAQIAIGSASITAAGLLKVTATATSEGILGSLPVGLILNTTTATIDITGNAVIDAGSASLVAS